MRKDYKENLVKKHMNKRGQISIFIILAIVIVASVLAFFLFPRIGILSGEVNPSDYLRTCIEQDLEDVKDILSRQGGYLSPENSVMYQGVSIQYLCYTSEFYKPCVVQQPLLVNKIESEMKSYLQPRAIQCVNNLKNEYERKGYSVSNVVGDMNVDIVQKKINVEFISPMTISKETTQSFEKFSVSVESEWYDLLLTAVSIIQYESTVGDSETGLYVQFYPDLLIDKIRRDDGTIYKLRNIITNDEFVFATKSLNWPRGYGG